MNVTLRTIAETPGMPLYTRVFADVADRIRRGEFATGQPIPTEHELCREYGVSRITVRRALEQLVQTHLLERRRGVGTFVRQHSENAKLLRLYGHLQDVLTFDQRLSYRVLARGLRRPPEEISAFFGTDPATRLYLIETLNRIDEEPYAISQFYFAAEYSDFAATINLADERPPLRYLEQAAGVRVESGEQSIEPAQVQGKSAKLLGLPPGTPVLSTLRRYFAEGHRPVEAVKVLYHPERYRFDVRLLTPGAPIRHARRTAP